MVLPWKTELDQSRIRMRRTPRNEFLGYASNGRFPIYVQNESIQGDEWVTCKFSLTSEHMLYLGGNDGAFGIFDARSDVSTAVDPYLDEGYFIRQPFRAHVGAIMDICEVYGQGNQVLTVSGDCRARLWDLNRCPSPRAREETIINSCREFMHHEQTVRSAAWCPYDSHMFVTGGRDGAMCVWDTRVCAKKGGGARRSFQFTPSRLHRQGGHLDGRQNQKKKIPGITKVTFIDEYLVASGSESCASGIRIWDIRKDLRTPVSILEIPGTGNSALKKDSGVASMSLCRTGGSLFVATTNSQVLEYAVTSANTKPTRRLVGADVTSYDVEIACSPVADQVICGSTDNAVVWDLQPTHVYLDDRFSYRGRKPSKAISSDIRPSYLMGGHSKSLILMASYSKSAEYIVTINTDSLRVWSMNLERNKAEDLISERDSYPDFERVKPCFDENEPLGFCFVERPVTRSQTSPRKSLARRPNPLSGTKSPRKSFPSAMAVRTLFSTPSHNSTQDVNVNHLSPLSPVAKRARLTPSAYSPPNKSPRLNRCSTPTPSQGAATRSPSSPIASRTRISTLVLSPSRKDNIPVSDKPLIKRRRRWKAFTARTPTERLPATILRNRFESTRDGEQDENEGDPSPPRFVTGCGTDAISPHRILHIKSPLKDPENHTTPIKTDPSQREPSPLVNIRKRPARTLFHYFKKS